MPTAGPRPKKDFISPPELARWLGIGLAAAYTMAKTGRVPCFHVGDRYLIPTKGVDKMVDGLIAESVKRIITDQNQTIARRTAWGVK